MKSIQTKFIILMTSCILLCSLIIGGAGILNVGNVVEDDSSLIMNLLCKEEGLKLDNQFSRIVQSVETLATYAIDKINDVEHLIKDQDYLESYTKTLESITLNAANNTEGAVSVYVRYNPKLWSSTAGLFWGKTKINGSFQKLPITDLLAYSPDDMERVGWYYVPIKNGKATWLSPYMNQNINIHMISYVIPIYKDNITIGIVGMDIDFDVITQGVEAMKIYDSGYAFLIDDNAQVMYHRDFDIYTDLKAVDDNLIYLSDMMQKDDETHTLISYYWNNEEKQIAFKKLSNGMKLALCAPVKEIYAKRNQLFMHITLATLTISGIGICMTIFLTRKMIRPLKELNTVAQKIVKGDLGMTISCTSQDEVGTLAKSFQQTVDHLKQYISYINGLAYLDSMTGIKNKTAYDDEVKRIENEMLIGQAEFGLVVFDINNLKYVNDTYGHDFGDMLIIEACQKICKTFKGSPVYRIGGDEFVVILENEDLKSYQNLIDSFQRDIIEHNQKCSIESMISIAKGIAIYNSKTDLVFANVFKRADDAMYQNKIAIKNQKKNNEEY